ncbi:MAG: MOSC domain-containing protein [Gemmatimonadaceae bacterium]
MVPVQEGVLVEGRGLADNVDRSRRRQITLIEREGWDRMMSELGADIDPSARRANILVSGMKLTHTRGRSLRIGDARIVVGGEVTPCERMDEALPGLRAAMRPDWRGGVFAQVVGGGKIRVGDAVEWED